MSIELYPLQHNNLEDPKFAAMSKFRRIKGANGRNNLLRYRNCDYGFQQEDLYIAERELCILESYGIELLPRQPIIFGSTTSQRIGYIVPEIQFKNLTDVNDYGVPVNIQNLDDLMEADYHVSKLLTYADDAFRLNPSREILYDLGLHQFGKVDDRIVLIDIDPLVSRDLSERSLFYFSIHRHSLPYLHAAQRALGNGQELESERLLKETARIIARGNRIELISRWTSKEELDELKAYEIECIDWENI